MRAHLVELRLRERTGLSEQLRREQELADVVQEAAHPDGVQACSSPLERLGDRERETRDAARVATRPGVRLLDRFRQVCDHGRQSSLPAPSSLLGERK